RRRDAHVKIDHFGFAEAGRGIKHLVEVGELEVPALERDVLSRTHSPTFIPARGLVLASTTCGASLSPSCSSPRRSLPCQTRPSSCAPTATKIISTSACAR